MVRQMWERRIVYKTETKNVAVHMRIEELYSSTQTYD